MNRKPAQLASIIHRAVQSVLAEGLADPRLEDVMVTVTDVNVAPDLRSATVLVSIMPDTAQSKAIHALKDAARFIRRQAAQRVSIHRMPDLFFKLDRGVKKQSEVLVTLSRLAQEREESEPGDTDTTEKPEDNAP